MKEYQHQSLRERGRIRHQPGRMLQRKTTRSDHRHGERDGDVESVDRLLPGPFVDQPSPGALHRNVFEDRS